MAAKLVSPEVLRDEQFYNGAKVVDCHYDMKNPAAGHEVYVQEHLPKAAHFRIENSEKKTESTMREFLAEGTFQNFARALGIDEGDKIVLYDRSPHGVGPAARAWYVLKTYGHNDVSVLSGGLGAWKAAGGDVESGDYKPEVGNFVAKLDQGNTLFLEEICDIAHGNQDKYQIVDARDSSMFEEKHIKSAVNIPISTFLEHGKIMPSASIAAVAAKKGLGRGKVAVTYCNSALMSTGVMFVLCYGGLDVKNYNGAMFEFGKKSPDLLGTLK